MRAMWVSSEGEKYRIEADDMQVGGTGVLTFFRHTGEPDEDGDVEVEVVAQFASWSSWRLAPVEVAYD